MLLRDLRALILRRARELSRTAVTYRSPAAAAGHASAGPRRQDFAPPIVPGADAESVDFLKVARARRATVWGMAQTPGNGLLHAVWSEADPLQDGLTIGTGYATEDGVLPGPALNARLMHAYSADGGRTWTVRDVRASAAPYGEVRRCAVAAGDRRLHLFVLCDLAPRGGIFPSADVVVTNPAGGPASFSVNLRYQYLRSGMPAGGWRWSPNPGRGGNAAGDAGTTVQATVRKSAEPGVDGIRLANGWPSVAGSEYEYYNYTNVLRNLPNATQAVTLVEKDFLDAPKTESGTVYRQADRAAAVHAYSAEDGTTWQAPQAVDLDLVPDDPGVGFFPNPSPPPDWVITAVDRRFGLPASRGGAGGAGPYGQLRELDPGLALCEDEAGGLLFLYLFDGKDHVDTGAPSNQVQDAELEAVYWKAGPSDPRAAIVRLAGGPAVGAHFGVPAEVWQRADLGIALWRNVGVTFDARHYAVRPSGGAWGSAQVFFQDISGDSMGKVRLHPAPGELVALSARFLAAQNRQRIDLREFSMPGLSWGAFSEVGGGIPATLLTRDGLAGAAYLDDRLRWLLSGDQGAASEVWYGRSEQAGTEARVFAEGAPPSGVSPALADARIVDAPRQVSGRTVHALLAGTPVDDADATDLYLVRVRNAR